MLLILYIFNFSLNYFNLEAIPSLDVLLTCAGNSWRSSRRVLCYVCVCVCVVLIIACLYNYSMSKLSWHYLKHIVNEECT